MLREAYKEMLLQQQTRHRTELAKSQAKFQRELESQVTIRNLHYMSNLVSAVLEQLTCWTGAAQDITRVQDGSEYDGGS